MQAKATPKRERVERGLYKRGKTYFACATPPGEGKPLWKSLGEVNLSEARRLRDEFVAEVKQRKIIRSKATFKEVATAWLTEQEELRDAGKLRPSTYTAYEGSLRLHVLPHFERRQIQAITPDDLVGWHRAMEKTGQAAWSIRKHWIALRGVLGHAARHGYATVNVADLLTRRERPKPGASRIRYLDADEMAAMFKDTPERYRVAILMAVFLGVRLSELLAIRWRDVAFKEGVVHITGQMDRKGNRVDYPKTAAGYRSIVLMTTLAKALKAYKLESKFSGPDDLVIASEVGGAMNPRNIAQRGLGKACDNAGLDDVTFHVLRHTFASMLIAQGHDPTYVANQLGHTKPSVTLDVYSHLFARARHADKHRELLDAEFGHLVK